MTSRGKSIVLASLKVRPKRVKQTPEFWIDAGLDQDGFDKQFISKFKGFGVFTNKSFDKGNFLLEYVGERLSGPMVSQRQLEHENSTKRQSKRGRIPRLYMFHFKYDGKSMCIDATHTKGRLGHFVNDAQDGIPRPLG